MSNFWAKAAGAPSAPAQRPQASPAWMPRYAAPSVPQAAPAATQPPPQQDPAVAESASRAPSSRSTAQCLGCGSGNYFPGGPGKGMARCFDCGDNGRFTSLGGGGIQGDSTGPVRAAKQVSTANNYNPGQIVAHVK